MYQEARKIKKKIFILLAQCLDSNLVNLTIERNFFKEVGTHKPFKLTINFYLFIYL